MRPLYRLFTVIVVSCVIPRAQAQFPMKYLDDVGLIGLGLPSSRDSVNLGFATVVSENGDALRFEGRDHGGDPWRVWIPQTSGAGWTDVWTADFDRNGHKDLLISLHGTAINGRCTLRTDAYSLLFDHAGRPVPWHISTEVPGGQKSPHLPAIVLDLNRNGRAEIVSTNCAYGDEYWTDWSVTGVYEAQDTQWVPLRTINVTPYVQAAAQGNAVGRWLSVQPGEWVDQLKGFDVPVSIKLESLIPSEENCHGINIQIDTDGRAVSPVNDPCDELRSDHASYSDGRTRRGWLWVVINGPHGREIFIANNEDALRRVIREGYLVKLLGNDAEPSWLWAEEAQAVIPLP